MKVTAHKLKDRAFDNWLTEVEGHWKITDLRADAGYCNDWISFDSLAWDAKRKLLYIGLTSINTDIFHTFDPVTAQFKSLDFRRVSDKFDVKFHRSIELDDDGSLFVATALLHDVDEQRQAKGGKLLRYNPDTDQYTLLGVPIASNYIQSILLDRKNRAIYGFSYPSEQFFRFDLAAGKVVETAYVGNGIMICQPHCAALDGEGRLWGTWGESRAYENDPGPAPIRIFCYDPASNEYTWYQHGFPSASPGDRGRVDHMFLATDGLIYVGSTTGVLCRLNPANGEVEYLGKPFPGGRLAGLMQASNGLIYGAGNAGYDASHAGTVRMFEFDPKTSVIKDLGRICDPATGAAASNIHMIVEGDNGTLYAGENDNMWRSSYLWEIQI